MPAAKYKGKPLRRKYRRKSDSKGGHPSFPDPSDYVAMDVHVALLVGSRNRGVHGFDSKAV
jgi:hypothetical protein